jgi:hypothetical protein
LFLISRIDPTQDDFNRQNIPIKELEEVLKSDGKKWGGLYDEMQNFSDKIISQHLSFPSNILVDGRPLKGKVNWFSHVMPNENERGEVCIEFEFAPILKNYLLKLKQYVQIDRLEVSKMKHRYSIRLYQLLRVALQKQEKYKAVIVKRYEVDKVRDLLYLDGAYESFKSFSQFVLKRAIDEINKYTSLDVEMNFIRARTRKVEEIEFTIKVKSHFNPNQLAIFNEKSWEEMSKEEKEAKRSKFKFERFKIEHKKVYLDKVREVNETFGDETSSPALEQSIRNYCEEWFVRNG